MTDSDRKQVEGEVSLLDLLIVLVKHKKLILGLPSTAAVLAVGFSLMMPDIFTATARILPPQQQQSTAAAMLGQLGVLAGAAGSSLGIKNPNDLYVGMLKSRTVADNLINHFKLKELYKKDTLVETYKTLDSVTDITGGKDGIISISVDDEDPKRSADIANAYVDELYKLSQSLAVTEASQRRLFFERQLKLTKNELANAEISFKQTQEKTGVLQLDAQGQTMIEAVGTLRAQIAAKEVELGALRTFATERNPDYLRLKQELIGLRSQLTKYEKGGESDIVPIRKLPEAGLENIRKLRDVKYYETLYELLAKQYEMARVDEARDASLIQVLDRATPPDRKAKPKRALIVILSAAGTGFLALILAFIRESYANAKLDPEQTERINSLRHHLNWHKQE